MQVHSGDVLNLALRRSLFFPSAEIYSNALAGFWDFGPTGFKIQQKIAEFWRKQFVQKEGFLEISGSQVLPKDVFMASGHLENFVDPVTECLKCHSVFRADQLIEQQVNASIPEFLPVEKFDLLLKEHKPKCPNCSSTNFGQVKKFNMMLKVEIGATGKQEAFLRPETCQTIFLAFDRLSKTMRQNMPFGIALAGTSFRNEISPRNALLRERELRQMEIEFFFNPFEENQPVKWNEIKDFKLRLFCLEKNSIEEISCQQAFDKKIVSSKTVAFLLARTQQFFEKLGFPASLMRFRQLAENARAFYAKETWDFEVKTGSGWVELAACNHRRDFDLKSHGLASKTNLKLKDSKTGQEFYPNVFEISMGLDRIFYVLLEVCFRKEKRGQDERIFLTLKPQIAPFLAGIFPLVNKDGLNETAKMVFDKIAGENLEVFFDDKASIGKRYARADEIGIPFGITVDYQTKQDNTVTLRERDTLAQKRIKINKLEEVLQALLLEKTSFEKL